MINNRIDWDRIDKWEGFSYNAVVPSNNSGVTLLGFIDLKEKSRDFFKGMGLDEEFLDKLETAYGKAGDEAKAVAPDITVDPINGAKMKTGTKNKYEDDLYALWNKSNPSEQWDNLGSEQQTIMMSLFLNQGWLPNSTPNFWRQTTSGDWGSAIENLRNFYPNNPDMARLLGKRRNEEADILNSWWSKKKSEPKDLVDQVKQSLKEETLKQNLVSPTETIGEEPLINTVDKLQDVGIEKIKDRKAVIDENLKPLSSKFKPSIFEREYPIDDEGTTLLNQYFRNSEFTKFITQSPDLSDSIKASLAEATLTGNLWQTLTMRSFVPEEGFLSTAYENTDIAKQYIKEYALDNDSLQWIAERAGSPEHWDYLASQVAKIQRNRELLARDGWRGIGLQIGSWLIDPANFNVYSRLGKGLSIIRNTANISKYQNFVKSGALVAGTEAALFSPVVYNQPTLGLNDVIIAGALGGTLGGGLNVLIAKAMNNVGKSVQRLDLEEKGARLKPEVAEKEFSAINKSQKETAKALDEVEDVYDLTGIENLKLVFPNARNVAGAFIIPMTKSGASGSSKSPLMKKFGITFLTDPIGWENTAVQGNKASRMIAQETVEDLRDQIMFTVNHIVYNRVAPAYSAWAKENGIWRIFKWTSYEGKQEWNRQVKRAVIALGRKSQKKNLSASEEALLQDKNIVAAANAYADGFEYFARALKDMGIEGAENLVAFRGYVPRKISAQKYYELVEQFGGGQQGEDAVLRLIRDAITDQQPLVNRAGNPVVKFKEGEQAFITNQSQRPLIKQKNDIQKQIKDLESKAPTKTTKKDGTPLKSAEKYQAKLNALKEKLAKIQNDLDTGVTVGVQIPVGKADLLARAILTAVKSSGKNNGIDIETLFRIKDTDNISEFVATHFDELAPDAQKTLVSQLEASMEILTSGRLAEKIKLNENFSTKINGRQTSLDELFENHIDNLWAGYANEMSGWLSIGSKTGIKSRKDLIKYKNDLKSDINKSYNPNKALENFRAKEEMDTVDAVFNNLFGRSGELDPTSGWSRINKGLRRYSFARVMGQVGIAQLPEFGVAVSQQGFRTLFNEIPMIRKLLDPKATGISDTLLDDLRVIGAGNGDEWLWVVQGAMEMSERGTMTPQLFVKTKGGRLAQKSEAFMDSAEKGVGFGSGLLLIDSFQRKLAMRLFVNKLANNLLEGGVDKLSQSWLNRYRVIGLDVDDLRKLETEFRNGGVVLSDTPFLGKRVLQFKYEQFKDRDLLRKFAIATNKYTRRAVQYNGIGDTSRIFSDTALGKTLGQFRSFVMVAWNKQFLHNVAMNDFQTYSMFMYTTLIGGLAYYGQTHFNTIGMSETDKVEYLKKRLGKNSDEFYLKMGLASFQRAGWSSVMPPMADYITANIAPNYRFNTRSSGQEMNLVTGNPTADLLGKISSSISSILKSSRSDYNFSQTDLNRIMRLFPFQNMYGVNQFLNWVKKSSGLPEKSDYNPYSNL